MTTAELSQIIFDQDRWTKREKSIYLQGQYEILCTMRDRGVLAAGEVIPASWADDLNEEIERVRQMIRNIL